MRALRLALGPLGLAAMAAAATAHPLGNTSINRLAGLTVSARQVLLDYELEFAEIPTLAASQQADRDGDGRVAPTEWRAWADARMRAVQTALRLHAGPLPLALQAGEPRWSLHEGAAGLAVLRVGMRLSAPLPDVPATAGRIELRYDDSSFAQERGWKDVWLRAGEGVRVLATDAASADRSQGLTRFDLDPAEAMPQRTQAGATIELRPAATEVAASAMAVPAPTAAPGGEAVPPGDAPARARAFFQLGMYHIASGWDHLAFLLGLLLLQPGFGPLVRVVTAFTLAHSTTLALAALGWVRPPTAPVEAGIALTIAYVGLANLRCRGAGHGLGLAFGFGLVHGFGFAGALAESLAGRPAGGTPWLMELAAFNLGIEAFQVLLVALLAPVLAWLRRQAWGGRAHAALSALVLAVGVGTLVARVMGS